MRLTDIQTKLFAATLVALPLSLSACGDDVTPGGTGDESSGGTTGDDTNTTNPSTTLTTTTDPGTTTTETTAADSSSSGEPTTGPDTDSSTTSDESSSGGESSSSSSSGGDAECGDGVIGGTEECDGDALGDAACPIAGDIACADDCTLDVSACTDTLVFCNTPDAAIDGTTTLAAPLEDVITVVEDFFVTDVNVSVDITHPWLSDIIGRIDAPDGMNNSLLFDEPCGSNDDINAVFDDDGVEVVCSGTPAISDTVLPVTELQDLIGISSMGDWTFVTWDDAPSSDNGTLNEWCVELTLSEDDPVVCGDDVAHYGEACDGADLNGLSCADLEGFSGGDLGCADDCTFDTSSCETPPPGDLCGDALIVDTDNLPYTDSGDTLLFSNDYSYSSNSCPGETGAGNGANSDVVYAFSPAVTGSYTIEFDATFDSTIYAVTDCADVDGTCVGAADDGNPETLVGVFEAGTTYYIIAGAWSNFTSGLGGDYTLTVSDVCFPMCDGMTCGNDDGCGGSCDCNDGDVCNVDTCVTPPSDGDTCDVPRIIPADGLPYTDTDTTVFYENDYGYSTGVCPGETISGNNSGVDVVYSFTPDVTGDYEFQFDAGFDSTIYMVTDCANVDGTCVAGADNGNPETISATLTAGTTYYIIGGPWGSFSGEGEYTLTATAL